MKITPMATSSTCELNMAGLLDVRAWRSFRAHRRMQPIGSGATNRQQDRSQELRAHVRLVRAVVMPVPPARPSQRPDRTTLDSPFRIQLVMPPLLPTFGMDFLRIPIPKALGKQVTH